MHLALEPQAQQEQSRLEWRRPQHRPKMLSLFHSLNSQLPSAQACCFHWQQCLVWAGQFARPPAFDRGHRREIVLGWSVLRLPRLV